MNESITELDAAIAGLMTPEDVMRFFNQYFSYGCIDVNGVKHIDSLGGDGFRATYRTLSLEDSLKNRIGACIEQTNVTKYLLNMMGIENRTFCTRGYNDEHRAPDDLYLVHCYTLAQFGGRILNIEHSDTELKGIYSFKSEEEAISSSHKLFSNKFIRHGATHTTLVEYRKFIPGGLSFLDFNRFINIIGFSIVI